MDNTNLTDVQLAQLIEYLSPFLTTIIVIGIIYLIGLLINVSCFILFIYRKLQKNEYFCTAFFHILNFGYMLDFICLIFFLLLFTENGTIIEINAVIKTYVLLTLGPWNTVLAMNRFTAVCFWKQHDFYWKGKCLAMVFAVLFLYPFIAGGYFIKDGYCVLNPSNPNCTLTTGGIQLVGIISNSIHVVITAVLGLSTAIATHCQLVTLTSETKKFARYLLFQSLATLLLFGGCLYNFLRLFFKGPDVELTMTDLCILELSDFYFVYFRVSSTVLLLLLSKKVRQSFIDFYFGFCCKQRAKRMIQTKTVFLTEQTIQNSAIKIT